ncbi:MAG: hypothetical protein QHI38_06275 [Armatimonadota bacterium]|nr:hypothetical protein [Armatimonadota bacterium]
MRLLSVLLAGISLLLATTAFADTLELKDGTIIQNCYVRDEGVELVVWKSLADVGTPNYVVYPRRKVKRFEVQRGDDWDKHPNLPDLTVTFIEINPKLAGLHGRVDYDQWGRPILKGGPILDLGEETAMRPQDAVKNLKLKYKPGEEITLTAHVKNVGFAVAKPFRYTWLIDDKEFKSGTYEKSLKEMEEATFSIKWRWQEGFHKVTFAVKTDQPQIATINDTATDPLWAFTFTYVVSKGRVAAWHQNRTAYGTFCFEDYYRWHLDIMNKLFEASKFPSSPEGIKARVRLDRIVYADDVEKAIASLVAPDGIRYDQGGWNWIDDQDRNKKWEPPTKEWRNSTEWSLPHELGHQLGLTDWYVLDYGGDENHLWHDTGEKITHFQNHPIQMMHWHGPQVYGEVDAGYLNMTWDKPRGHFGDYYFAIPRNNYLRIVDVNGIGVPGAKVEIYQRGCEVDKSAQPGEDHGVKYYPVIEDGNFDKPLSKDPVIVGETDANGILRLPNRPVKEVRTLNGFHRQPNPFGNINVVGQRGDMLVKVTKDNRPTYFWLEIYDFNVAWFRGQKDDFTIVLKTPYRSASSPLAPRSVKAEQVGENKVRVTWEAPEVVREQQYLDRVIGYRVYRRIGSDCLNDRPWFPVATLGPDAREFTVDMTQYPDDIFWFSKTNRFAVSSLGELSMESELVETVIPQK